MEDSEFFVFIHLGWMAIENKNALAMSEIRSKVDSFVRPNTLQIQMNFYKTCERTYDFGGIYLSNRLVLSFRSSFYASLLCAIYYCNIFTFALSFKCRDSKFGCVNCRQQNGDYFEHWIYLVPKIAQIKLINLCPVQMRNGRLNVKMSVQNFTFVILAYIITCTANVRIVAQKQTQKQRIKIDLNECVTLTIVKQQFKNSLHSSCVVGVVFVSKPLLYDIDIRWCVR